MLQDAFRPMQLTKIEINLPISLLKAKILTFFLKKSARTEFFERKKSRRYLLT